MPLPLSSAGSRLPSVLVALALATAMAVPMAGAQSSDVTVTIEDQTSGGTTLEIAETTLPNGGFVAIHDASIGEGEVLGSVVGASDFLDEGTHEDVRVHLSEPVTEDAQLIAMPHEDTDGDHIYDFVADNGNTDGPYTADGEAVTDGAEITTSATVTATDQRSDGESVIVDRVEMAEGGFVAIHDDRLLDGQPLASVVGHSGFLSAGVHEDVRVELSEPVSGNETIIPMPHADSDDDQTYDFITSDGQDDPPYRNGDDEAVIAQAEATVTDGAQVTYEAQTSGGHTVHVAEVFLPDGGFVTIHDSSLADGQTFESVRGSSQCLDPGVHRDVAVELDDTLDEDDTLIAMPHEDTNNNCSYDFVTSDGSEDGPYTDDDGIVTDGAETTVSASVSYDVQDADGRTIEVGHVDLSQGGFVAVHDSSLFAGEVLGSVVGVSSYLDAGTYENVEIELDTPLKTSQVVVPMPHKDTNGDETYNFVDTEGADDGPFATSEGNPVVDSGLTVVNAQITIQDQDAGSSVSVASVTMHEGGFVTIHDGSLLEGEVLGSVIGVSEPLSPGTHEDVDVPLDEQPDGEASLIAMPHYDTNGNDAYDFVDSEGTDDGPYVTDKGAIVHVATGTFATDDTDDSTDGDASPNGDGRTDGETGDETSSDDEPIGADTEDAPGPGLLAALAALAAVAAFVAPRRR